MKVIFVEDKERPESVMGGTEAETTAEGEAIVPKTQDIVVWVSCYNFYYRIALLSR